MSRRYLRTAVVVGMVACLVLPAQLPAAGEAVTPAVASSAAEGPTEPVESGVVLAGGGAGWGGTATEARLGTFDARLDRAPDGSWWVGDGSRLGLLSEGRLTLVASDLDEVRDVAARPDGSAYVLTSSALLAVAQTGARTELARVPAGFVGSRVALLSDGRAVVAGGSLVKVLAAGALVDLGSSAQPWRNITDIAGGAGGADAGALYVRTTGSNATWVWRRDAEGLITQVAGTGTGAGQLISPTGPIVPARSYGLTSGGDVQVDPSSGDLWLSAGQSYGDQYTVALRVTPAGQLSAAALASTPCSSAHLAGAGRSAHVGCGSPGGLVVRSLVGTGAPYSTGPAVAGTSADTESSDGIVATEAFLPDVRDLAVAADGRTWLATPAGLRYVSGDGTLRTALRAGSSALPDGLTALASDGPDVVVATGHGRVLRVSGGPDPRTTSTVSPVGSGWVAAVDVAVDDGSVYVADSGLSSVRRVDGAVTTDVLTGRPFSSVAAGPRGVVASYPSGIIELTAEGGLRTLSNSRGATLGHWDGRWLVAGGDVQDIRPDYAMGVLLGHVGGGRRAEGYGAQVLIAEKHRAIRVVEPLPSWVPPAPQGLTATARPGYVELTWEDDGFYQDEVDVRRGAPPVTAWHWRTGTCAGPTQVDDTSARVWCDTESPDGLVQPGVDYGATIMRRANIFAGSRSFEVWAPPVSVNAQALPDDGPPPAPVVTSVVANSSVVNLEWSVEPGIVDRLRPEVVRYKEGTAPPTSPTDGEGLDVWSNGSASIGRGGGLEPETDYTFAIFSVDYRGNVGTPATVTARLDTAGPGPVSDVQVSPTFRAARVTWTPPSDPDYRGTIVETVPAGQQMQTTDCFNAFIDPPANLGGLRHGTAYTVWLRTCDTSGNAGEAVSVDFTTPTDDTPPDPPGDVSATVSGKTITVTWTPPVDPEPTSVFTRLVEGSEPPAGVSDGMGTFNSAPAQAVYRNLKGSTTYTVVAFARDANGNDSAPSDAVTVVTEPDTTAPTLASTALTATPLSDGTVSLRLTPPFPVFDFDGVQLAVTPAADVPTVPGDGTRLDDLRCGSSFSCTRSVTLPTLNTPYRITAWPFDVTGNVGSPVSVVTQGTLVNPALPGSPWAAQAHPNGQNQLRVTWQGASAGAGADGAVTAYEVEVDQRDGGIRAVHVPAWQRQADVGGLLGGAPLTVRVYAVNAAGRSATPATLTATPEDVLIPAAVSSLSATGRYGGHATVGWTPSSSFDVRRYEVRWVPGTTPPDSLGAGVALTTSDAAATLSGLPRGQDVAIAVFGVDWAGNVSPRRTIVLPGTRLSVTTSPRTITYGSTTRMTGRLLRSDGAAVAGQRVVIRRRLNGWSSWSTVKAVTTSATGGFALDVSVARSAELEAYHADSGYGDSRATTPVGVRLAVTAKAPTAVRYRSRLVVTGKVRPAKAGRVVSLQRYVSGKWRTVDTARTTTVGTFRLVTRPPRGRWALRVVGAGDRYHGTGKSRTVRTRVY